MPTPLVSVIIPTYNRPDLLDEAIKSVSCQTLDALEILVVNDGSIDDTGERVEVLARSDPRIRLITQSNAGTGAARNRGLAEARAEFVALLDHDDLWAPDKLKLQVDFLQQHPECIAALTPLAFLDRPDQLVLDGMTASDEQGIVRRPFRLAADKVPLFLTCSGLMFRRKAAEGITFATERGAIEDVPFYVRLLARGGLGIAGRQLRRPLVLYRRHGANTSSTAAYYGRGRRLLRREDRQGRFGDTTGQQLRDLSAWFAFIGRAAAVTQLLHGRRLDALGCYVSECPHQLRDGRLDFLMAFPAMLLTPSSLVRRWASRSQRPPR